MDSRRENNSNPVATPTKNSIHPPALGTRGNLDINFVVRTDANKTAVSTISTNEVSSAEKTSATNLELECARLLRAFHNGYRSDMPLECESVIKDPRIKKTLQNTITYTNRIPPPVSNKDENHSSKSFPEVQPRTSSSPISDDDFEIKDRFLRRVTSTISNFTGVLRKTSNENAYINTTASNLSLSSSRLHYTEKVFEREKTINQEDNRISNFTQRRISCSKNKSDQHPSYCESYEHYLMTGYTWE